MTNFQVLTTHNLQKINDHKRKEIGEQQQDQTN